MGLVQDRIALLEQVRNDTENGSSFAAAEAQKMEEISQRLMYELEGSASGEEAAQAVAQAADDLTSIASALSEASASMLDYINRLQS